MTQEQEIILKHYNELKVLGDNECIHLSDKLNTKYLKILNFLEEKGYIRNLHIDGGSMYIKCEAFDDFEENYREEIGEPLPKLFTLVNCPPDFNSLFYIFDEYWIPNKIIFDVQQFIDWKNDVKYELEKLKKSETVINCGKYFDAMNGLNDEELLSEILSLLSIIVDNYNEFIISKINISPLALEGENSMYEKIFISHKSCDKKYGDAIAELLNTLGLRNDQIIYTSHPLYKIPNNQTIYDYLKNNISKKIFCLFIFSNEYFESSICMNEMGAFWVTQSEYQNSFVPHFDFENYNFKNCVIDSNKIGFKYIDDSMSTHSLIEFKNNIVEKFGLDKLDDNAWEYALTRYKNAISKTDNSNGSLIVSASQLESESDSDIINLLTPASDSGKIMKVKALEGTTIFSGTKAMNIKGNMKDTARLEDTIKKAIKKGFLEQTDKNGMIFEITYQGYELIDQIK